MNFFSMPVVRSLSLNDVTGKQIAIIQGHPDAIERHYGHVLADYAQGAAEAITTSNGSKWRAARLLSFVQKIV